MPAGMERLPGVLENAVASQPVGAATTWFGGRP